MANTKTTKSFSKKDIAYIKQLEQAYFNNPCTPIKAELIQVYHYVAEYYEDNPLVTKYATKMATLWEGM